MTDSSLANDILQVVSEHEAEWEEKLANAEGYIDILQQEIDELQVSLAEPTAYGEVFDEILRERLSKLPEAMPDTIIRECGVVLEDRLREAGNEESKMLIGASLADAVFHKDSGNLIFSDHPNEQDGVRFLYRGAIQFIRNPPMHRLIEYPEETAKIFVRMIDSLLMLLKEGKPPVGEDVALECVRLMLTRRPVSRGQKKLYILLYDADDKGMTNSEIAKALEFSNYQFAGLMGALGRRINQTKGMEGSGGIDAIFEITPAPPDKWRYVMNPVLREALKLEGII